MSSPNQKIVKIHKPKYQKEFLQIGIQEWQEAHRVMNYSEFCLYLYLAGNADGFNLELSQQAFENATGFKKTAYHEAVNKLISLGYIYQVHGNVYAFHTCPVRESERTVKSFGEVPKSGKNSSFPRTEKSAATNIGVRSGNREIYKTDKTDKIDKKNENNRKTFSSEDEIYPDSVIDQLHSRYGRGF